MLNSAWIFVVVTSIENLVLTWLWGCVSNKHVYSNKIYHTPVTALIVSEFS